MHNRKLDGFSIHNGTDKTIYVDYSDLRCLQLYKHNTSRQVPHTNMGVLTRRTLINKILGGRIPSVELLIDERCVHLIEDLEGTKLGLKGKEKKRTKDRDTGVSFEKYGHASDALDYLLCDLCGQHMEQ